MKKLSTYLFLFLFSFSVPSFAEDISEFQIEGMSLGDSLLDYFSEEEIINNVQDYYSYIDDKFSVTEFNNSKLFNNYDGLKITFKTYDNDFVIHGLSGGIFFDNNIEGCYKKRDEISNEVSTLFKNVSKEGPDFTKHPADQSNKSTASGVSFFLKNGNVVLIDCIDWSEEMRPYMDNLSVNYRTKEFNDWLY
jgi:hypothetical protein|tara:strand:- start:98 stop:673 length:576 start_codon:yes stop_codon:yes gene_type:complete